MFSFCKKKPVVLNFYTAYKAVFEEAKPTKGVEQLPNWWKQLSNSYWDDGDCQPMSTAKRCAGIIDLYKKAIVLPLASDVSLELGPTGDGFFRWASADNSVSVVEHPIPQRGSYLPNDRYQHIKMGSPWFVQCDEDVEFMFFQPTYNFETPETFIIPPAVINFKYQNATHVNIFLPRNAGTKKLLLEAGQPIVGLVPLTDRPIEMRFHLVTQNEIHEMARNITTFSNSYARHKDKLNGKKCPVRGA